MMGSAAAAERGIIITRGPCEEFFGRLPAAVDIVGWALSVAEVFSVAQTR